MTRVEPDRHEVLRVLSERGRDQHPWVAGAARLTPVSALLTRCSHACTWVT